MPDAGKKLDIYINGNRAYQKIDGFGVNINSKYWDQDRLIPTMDLLREDLGATLYRVDIWGKSNWVDPTSQVGPSSLNESNYSAIYQGDIFQRGWAMMRYLNSHGIEPYLTASGDVPTWMLGPDRKSLADYDAFCEMQVSMVDWAKNKEHLRFTLFGPLNEIDVGSPEGPSVNPVEFVKVLEILEEKLTRRELGDIRLVVPETGFGTSYLKEILRSRKLIKRIDVFGLHDYSDIPRDQYQEVLDLLKDTSYTNCRLWMTEYGDLEQSGEKEWYVGWWMTSRLFDQLENGFNGALVWDAYDNYHDHDETWTIYGLLRTGLRLYTPKKRYYASKQVFRYVLPGFERLEVSSVPSDLRVLAFANTKRTQFTLVGMNNSYKSYHLNVTLGGFQDNVIAGKVAYFRTSENENCYRIGEIPVRGANYPFTGIDAQVSPDSIFTLATE
jgi:hypothetical protein